MQTQTYQVSPRTVVITGAAGNLGRAVVAAFAARGEQLVLLDREQALAGASFQGSASARLTLACDLTNPASVQAAVEAALSRFGRIDVLCNLAGGFQMGESVHQTSDATWNFLFDLNVRSLLHMTRAAVPAMLEIGRGWIVNVGAAAAARGSERMGTYAASKSVVVRLTESMAAELRHQGINVNCVLPSILDTPENRKAMPRGDPSQWVRPADLAEVIFFLCSDSARAVHGACIPVTALS